MRWPSQSAQNAALVNDIKPPWWDDAHFVTRQHELGGYEDCRILVDMALLGDWDALCHTWVWLRDIGLHVSQLNPSLLAELDSPADMLEAANFLFEYGEGIDDLPKPPNEPNWNSLAIELCNKVGTREARRLVAIHTENADALTALGYPQDALYMAKDIDGLRKIADNVASTVHLASLLARAGRDTEAFQALLPYALQGYEHAVQNLLFLNVNLDEAMLVNLSEKSCLAKAHYAEWLREQFREAEADLVWPKRELDIEEFGEQQLARFQAARGNKQ